MPYFLSPQYKHAEVMYAEAQSKEKEGDKKSAEVLYRTSLENYEKARVSCIAESLGKEIQPGVIPHALCDNAWSQAYLLYCILNLSKNTISDEQIEDYSLKIEQQIAIAEEKAAICEKIDFIKMKDRKGYLISGKDLSEEYKDKIKEVQDVLNVPEILQHRIAYYKTKVSLIAEEKNLSNEQNKLLILLETLADRYSILADEKKAALAILQDDKEIGATRTRQEKADKKKGIKNEQLNHISDAISIMNELLNLHAAFKKTIPISLHLTQLRNYDERRLATPNFVARHEARNDMQQYLKKYQLKELYQTHQLSENDQRELRAYLQQEIVSDETDTDDDTPLLKLFELNTKEQNESQQGKQPIKSKPATMGVEKDHKNEASVLSSSSSQSGVKRKIPEQGPKISSLNSAESGKKRKILKPVQNTKTPAPGPEISSSSAFILKSSNHPRKTSKEKKPQTASSSSSHVKVEPKKGPQLTTFNDAFSFLNPKKQIKEKLTSTVANASDKKRMASNIMHFFGEFLLTQTIFPIKTMVDAERKINHAWLDIADSAFLQALAYSSHHANAEKARKQIRAIYPSFSEKKSSEDIVRTDNIQDLPCIVEKMFKAIEGQMSPTLNRTQCLQFYTAFQKNLKERIEEFHRMEKLDPHQRELYRNLRL